MNEVSFLFLKLSSDSLNPLHTYFTISFGKDELNRFTSTTYIISQPKKELLIEIWDNEISAGYFEILIPSMKKESDKIVEELNLINGKLILEIEGKTIKLESVPILIPKDKSSIERKAIKALFRVYYSFHSPSFEMIEEMYCSYNKEKML